MRATTGWSGIAVVLVAALAAAASDPPVTALAGEHAERFLATAEVVQREKVAVGVTRPQRLTLSDGALTRDAVWKTVDVFRPRQRMADGHVQLGFRDSYRSEIAAYRLSSLLGLDLVPPTVERRIDGEQGSLQLWLEHCISERERQDTGLHPPDLEAWNRQMATVRLFHLLIHDTDFNNINNLLVSDDFRVWVIDSSRSFNLDRDLRNEDALTRFSRSLLEGLRGLDMQTLRAALEPWLSKAQIRALLERRDRILDVAERRVAEQGEAAVLFP